MENFAKMGFLASRTGGQPRSYNLGQNKWNIWTTPLFLFVLSKIIESRETFFHRNAQFCTKRHAGQRALRDGLD